MRRYPYGTEARTENHMFITRIRKAIFKGKTDPLPADYHDEVTDEHLKKIKKIVPQDELADAEEISKPAW